ncbi:DUF2568 domain-containing protein [Nocardioides sp. LS1]|uniref:DUF2568 domain-containing protein n=1 Tax=Nocardioides sp. LS1 TaxID=1027620 RepID=UPI000FFA3D6B|nr:DUF2568 domain-containing protein [Nocardioides sp. LS1]GCD90863.1 hypothetical protein NLS1_28690 [Nocardioides sp. LS1]
MVILGWSVLALVFVDEVLAVVAAGVWGQHAAGWWLAVLAPVVTMLVWFLFASPKAEHSGPVVRPGTKVLVFTLAALGLWVAGHHGPAVAFLAFSVVVNAVAQAPSIRALMAAAETPLSR